MRFAGSLAALFAAFSATSAFAAGLKITSTTFGWNPQTGTTTAGGLGPLGQFPAMPLNQPIELFFDDDLDKGSVDLSSVTVTTVPADVLTPLGATSSLPGGLIAPVNYSVKGPRLTITPALYFTGGNVNFGYVPGAFYYIRLAKNGLEGEGGGSIGKTLLIGFRTTSQILDMATGAPRQVVKLLDSEKGGVTLPTTDPLNPKAKFEKATPAPPPRVRFRFNEVVLTSTIVNPATGISPTLKIELDSDNDGTTVADRVLLPGRFNIVQTQKRTRVDWTPFLAAIPPEHLYLVTVEPLIEDLLGNSLFEQTGDIGAKRVYAFKTKPGGGVELPPLVEEFDNGDNKDVNATSADWAVSSPGFMLNGVAGGTGLDGAFKPLSDTTLSTSVFDSDLGKNVPRIYNFSTVEIPAGVSVRALGEFGLAIRATGPVTVNGTLNGGGANGEFFDPVRIGPGLPGVGAARGGSGGQGGSVTNGIDLGTSLFFAGTPSGYAAAAQANQGISGFSSAIAPFDFTRSTGPAFVAGFVGIWLQPNCGTGSSIAGASPGNAIFYDHPTFKISAVQTANLLTVDNTYGPLNQPGLDLYEFPAPPIAKPGDPYLIGDLAGHAGVPVGYAGSDGAPSLPVTVAQSFLTLARSGGGGGGGSKSAGLAGENAPVVGTQSGTPGGAGGTAYVTGTVTSKTSTTLSVSGTPFAGLDLDGGTDTNVDPPFVIVPDAAAAFVFEIASSTSNSVTIHPIALSRDTDADTNNDNTLDLDDVPGLGAGKTFRLEPPHSFGGSGGGGSGVHCANTTKLSPAPNLTLPTWTPGAGGGAGGGSVVVESAGTISVGASGKILADGGDGGETTSALSTSASGGGGGGGGSVILKSASASAFAVTVAGLVDARGGLGGVGFVDGGAGGDGRIRLENFAGNLSPANFSLVLPNPGAPDLGYLIPGLSPTAGQSEFLASGTLTANYTSYTVKYTAKVDGNLQNLEFTLADFQAGDEAPFEITFNDAGLTGSGDVDPATVDDDFVEDLTTLHLSFLRFRIVIEPSKIIDGAIYEDVRIDRVEIHYNQA